MPNPDFNDVQGDRGGKGKSLPRSKSGSMGSVNEKTAAWPGLPGKAGPNRSAGVKKCPTYPSSEGL